MTGGVFAVTRSPRLARISRFLDAPALRPVAYLVPALVAGIITALVDPVRSDWRYLAGGARIMFGGGPQGGLHTYASFTQLQIGPLTFAVVRGLQSVTTAHASALTVIAIVAILPAIIWLAERTVVASGRTVARALLATAGLLCAPVWADLVLRHHLDDALAVSAVVGVAWAVATGRLGWAATFAIAGCAAKPWAVIAIPMLLVLPRRRMTVCLAAIVGTAAVYAPFVFADAGTLHAGRPNVLVSGASLLRLAGFPVGVIPSAGVRVAQLLVALALGSWLIRRAPGGWLVLPAACIAARLLLDPGTFPYYAAGLVAAAVLADMWIGRRIPVLTVAVVGVWAVSYAAPVLSVAVVRTALLVAVLGLALAVTDPRRRPARAAP